MTIPCFSMCSYQLHNCHRWTFRFFVLMEAEGSIQKYTPSFSINAAILSISNFIHQFFSTRHYPYIFLHFGSLSSPARQENATKVDLLHCLTTPLLHDSTIQCGWPTMTHIRMIIENLLRSKAHSEIVLSSLTLVNFWDGRRRTAQTTAMIVDLLAHFPTIKSFVMLDLKADVSDLFQAMTFGAQDHLQLLPHLTDLQVKWDHQAYRQYPVALNVMINSRCWAGSERDLTDDRREFCRSSEQWRLKRVVMRGFPEFQREIQPIRDISGLDLNYMNWWED
ncbi:MAG: hypothetical protein NXY57DRAFT_1000648 [Lentinula lateritia]|uniref:Uncharacterized protein n=1 Tax=Lentinula lateritia TaxID=40482 RepID=A0ABQ8VNL1_9AGAR|nr:MAG: hypothetical protein NXY57DRAFT_1000648 [Lentinula lateritia]KAJ4496799.1 hypothetical protein C8R41DRAFT_824771 [Lentinula lateritia]